MKEQLITIETAKLAKEKGFDWKVLHSYRDEILDNQDYYTGTINNMYFNANGVNRTKFKQVYSASTQSLLQKWLREKHNIDVESRRSIMANNLQRYQYFIHINKDNLTWQKGKEIQSYEQALEKGLQEALKLIKWELKNQEEH